MTVFKKCFLMGLLVLAGAQAVFASGEASFPILGGEETLWIGNSLVGRKLGGLSGYTDAALGLHNPPLSHLYERNLIWAKPLQVHYLNDGTEEQENTLTYNGVYSNWPTLWVNAVDAIRTGHPNGNPWNYVVMQCFNPDDINANPTNFYKYVRKFDLVCRMYGAQPVLFMRWASNPTTIGESAFYQETSNINTNYTSVGEEIGAPAVPIAVMWKNLYDTPLFSASDFWSDGIHPTEVGKAIAVYAFYSMMTHSSPIGLNFQFGGYNSTEVANFTTVDNAIEQEVWNTISAREVWDNPGYVTPSPSGDVVVYYDPIGGNIRVVISGQVKAVRIGCPQQTYLNVGANPLIDGKAADLKDAETMTWYKPAGFAAGTYNLGPIVTPGSPQNRIGYAFTPSSGRASGGIVQLMVIGPTPPYFTSDPILKPDAQENVTYDDSIAEDAFDLNPGDTLTFSKLSGPAWLTVAANGTLSGTPASSDAGPNSFTVQVDDGNGGTDTATLEIYVTAYVPGSEIVVRGSGPALAGASGAATASFTATNSGAAGNYLIIAAVSETSNVTSMTFNGSPMTELLAVNTATAASGYVEFFGIAASSLSGTVNVTYSGNIYGSQIFGYAFLDGVDTASPLRATAGGVNAAGTGSLTINYSAAAVSGDFAMLASNKNGYYSCSVSPADVTLYAGNAGASFAGAVAYDAALIGGSYSSTFTFGGTTQREVGGGVILKALPAPFVPNPDITGEGDVNLLDFERLSSVWLNSPCAEPAWCDDADIDHSGAVDIDDLKRIAESWLK